MYSPRSQFADLAVLRPKRAQTEMMGKPQKPDAGNQHSADLNSIFKRLTNNNKNNRL